MYVFCVYPAMSNKSKNLSDLDKKRKETSVIPRLSSMLSRVSSSWSVLHYYQFHTCLCPPLYIATRYQESLFVGWKVYSSSTNKAKIYSYSIFVQQMYWLQDKYKNWKVLCFSTIFTHLFINTCKLTKGIIIIKQWVANWTEQALNWKTVSSSQNKYRYLLGDRHKLCAIKH